MSDPLTSGQVARLLGVTRGTVVGWAEKGMLVAEPRNPHYGPWRFRRAEVDALIAWGDSAEPGTLVARIAQRAHLAQQRVRKDLREVI